MAKFPITDKADPTFSITHSDINECLTNNGGCHHNCHNSVGSYSCSCNNGYQLNSDGHTCEGRLCSLHIETILSDISSDDLKPYYTILNIARESYYEMACKFHCAPCLKQTSEKHLTGCPECVYAMCVCAYVCMQFFHWGKLECYTCGTYSMSVCNLTKLHTV